MFEACSANGRPLPSQIEAIVDCGLSPAERVDDHTPNSLFVRDIVLDDLAIALVLAVLKVPRKQPTKGRIWRDDRWCALLQPKHPNHIWSYDFIEN